MTNLNHWVDIDADLFEAICSYCSIQHQLILRVVCQQWRTLINPSIFKYISLKMISHPMSHSYLSQYGAYFTHLVTSRSFHFKMPSLTLLNEQLPNIESISLSPIELGYYGGYTKFLKLWPNIEFLNVSTLTKGSSLDFNELRRLRSLRMNLSDLTPLTRTPNDHLQRNLRELELIPKSFNPIEFYQIVNNFPNLLKLTLSFKVIRLSVDELNQLSWCIIQLTNLETLRLDCMLVDDKLSTNPNSLNGFLLVQKLRCKLLELELSIFANNLDNDNTHTNDNCKQTLLGTFKDIFQKPFPKLKRLSLSVIDTNLLNLLTIQCQSLIYLKLGDQLPIHNLSLRDFASLKPLELTQLYREDFLDPKLIVPALQSV